MLPVQRLDWAIRRCSALVITVLAIACPAAAHPVPFSYLDVQLQPAAVDVSLVAHIFDLGHDLRIAPAEQLLDSTLVAQREREMQTMIAPRLELAADGRVLTPVWGATEILRDRQSLRFHLHYAVTSPPGAIAITTVMFPYDPMHQTFVNM